MDETALLLDDSGPIRIDTWDQVVRSVVMLADTVWVHASATLGPDLDGAFQNHVRSTLDDLVGEGLVRRYSFESDPAQVQRSASRIISREEHLELYNTIIESVQSDHSYIPDILPDPERTSRIIERRHELWRFGLATMMSSDLAVAAQKPLRKNSIKSEIERLAINAELTTELFSRFNVPSLAGLTTGDILETRQMAGRFKKTLSNLELRAASSPDGDVVAIVDQEFRDYMAGLDELLRAAAGKPAFTTLARNTVINIVGVFFSPMAALACGLDLYSYFRNRKKYSFMLFMHSVGRGRSSL